MLTESQNPQTTNIDQLSTLEMVQRINDEDAKVALAVREALPQIAQAIDGIAERMQRGGRLIYIGAGTSGRLGVLDASECVPTFSTDPAQVVGLIAGGETALTHSIEGAEDDPAAGRADLLALNLTADDSVVGIAASGRTPYVLGAIAAATEVGALTVGVACNVPSALLDAVQIPIGVLVGAEVITGSTRMKSGTAQKLVLNMLSTGTMVKLGKVYGNLMVDVRPTNSKLVDRASRIISQITALDHDAASRLLEASGGEVKTAIVMGRRGVDADEARALLCQCSWSPARGDRLTADQRHDPRRTDLGAGVVAFDVGRRRQDWARRTKDGQKEQVAAPFEADRNGVGEGLGRATARYGIEHIVGLQHAAFDHALVANRAGVSQVFAVTDKFAAVDCARRDRILHITHAQIRVEQIGAGGQRRILSRGLFGSLLRAERQRQH